MRGTLRSMRREVSESLRISNRWLPWDCWRRISRQVVKKRETNATRSCYRSSKICETSSSAVSRESKPSKPQKDSSTLQTTKTNLTRRPKTTSSTSSSKQTAVTYADAFPISRSTHRKPTATTWSKSTPFWVSKPPDNPSSTNSSKSSNPTVFTSIIVTCVFWLTGWRQEVSLRL